MILGNNECIMEISISSTEYVFQARIQLGNGKVYSVRSKEYITLLGHVHRSCGLYKPFGFNVGTDLNHFRLYTEDDIRWLEFEADKA